MELVLLFLSDSRCLGSLKTNNCVEIRHRLRSKSETAWWKRSTRLLIFWFDWETMQRVQKPLLILLKVMLIKNKSAHQKITA